MKKVTFDELDDTDRELIQSAIQAMDGAYAPYSEFAVGAAVLTKNGKIYKGANLENAVYGLGICAEVTAFAAANTAERPTGALEVQKIAVIGGPMHDPRSSMKIVSPCGRCRQVIFEAAQSNNVDIKIFSCSGDLSTILESTIGDMLPYAFGAATLV
jgi:cytidine deaminase